MGYDIIKYDAGDVRNKTIIDTNDQFFLEDLLNMYLYYKLVYCNLNKNTLATTTSQRVLFQNSVIYNMFTCFNDL